MKVSWSPLRRARVVARFAACVMLTSVLAACGGREQQQEAQARRARQMRDVSRMLDAMEADTAPRMSHAASMAPAPPPPLPASASAPDDERPAMPLLAMLALAVAGGATVPAFIVFARRRRKRRLVPRPEESRAGAATVELSLATAQPEQVVPSPPWVYRSSTFETPPIRLASDPVNLLVPTAAATPPVRAADPTGHTRGLHAPPGRQAVAQLSHEEREARAALDTANDDTRPVLLAQWMRACLARVERLSGATRLFALRELVAAVEHDPAATAPVVIDARIEIQLTWASWVRGDAAVSRLAEAERLSAMLNDVGPPATALGLRRQGQVFLRRAELAKGQLALSHMERAQACFDEAHSMSPDADTALLVARTALLRARSLPAADAANACHHALVHAFLAEQDAGCRAEALACRLDIQLTYAAFATGDDRHTGVTASLGRDLEATGSLAPAVRMALAEACLHEGAPAKTASLCESIWNDGGAPPGLLDLWRDACQRWSGIEGRNRQAHARSLRLLAIARSSL